MATTAVFSQPEAAADTATAAGGGSPAQQSVPAGAISPTDETLPQPPPGATDWPTGFDPIPDHQFLGILGRGGMGVVLRARHTKLDRVVAIKLPRAGTWSDDEDQERFLREARAAAKLRHPDICPIYEIGQVGQRPYISMACIEGQSLAEWSQTRRPNARQAAEMLARLARAVAYAHEHGVLHRDIKPSNVMVDAESGQPVLMDFGLAKELGGQSSQLTQDGQVMGTPAYMAPEQAAGRIEQVGTAADVYALGGVLYYLLCGRPPFQGSSGEVLRQVQTNPPAAPRKLAPHTHRDLETICLKAMAKDLGDRYASAVALAEDLERFAAGESILARRQGLFRKVGRAIRRRPLTVASSVLAVTAAMLFGNYALRNQQLATLQSEFDRVLRGGSWNQGQLHRADRLIAELNRMDPSRAAAARESLHEGFAEAIGHEIQKERLSRDDVARIEAQLDQLATRSSLLAEAAREQLRTRVSDWQPQFELKPPFADVPSVFNEKSVQVQGDGLLALGNVVLTSVRCPARARLDATFDPPGSAAAKLGLLLGANVAGNHEQDGYTCSLEIMPPPETAAASPASTVRSAEVRILRGSSLLRQGNVQLAAGPLSLSATRNWDRVTFQVNQLPPLEFLDAFPVPEDDSRVLACQWPQGMSLRHLRASVQPLAPAASPLELGDSLFARRQYPDALAQYQKQAIASGTSEYGQEARLKQALCLLEMQQLPEAMALLQRTAAETGSRWPLVAGCRLWELHLRQGKLDEAQAVFDGLSSQFRPDEVKPLVPATLISVITSQYHERSMGLNLFVYNPHEIRDLERSRAVLDFFGDRGPAYDATRYYLARAYHMDGQLRDSLQLFDSLAAEKPTFGGDRQRWFQLHEMHSWLLRLNNNPRGALAALDQQLLQPGGGYRRENLGLLVERARVHAALDEWDLAEKDLDDLLSQIDPKELTYCHVSGAALVRGFLRERRNDGPGALAAWQAGVPGAEPPHCWEEMVSIEGIGQGLVLASLSQQFTVREIDILQERALRRLGVSIDPGILKAAMRVFLMDLKPEQMASIVRQMAQRPQGREAARQIAFRDRPVDQILRNTAAAVILEIVGQLLVEGPLSPDQEQLCRELAEQGYTAHLAGRLKKDQLMQVMFTWRGLTDTLGWAPLSASLEPSLRGPGAYWLGHRFLKLRMPAQAEQFFRTALADARPNSVLQRLAQAELDRLATKPPSGEP